VAAILGLVAAGAAVDAQGDVGRLTALHGAAAMGHAEAVEALVGAGAALESIDRKQRTPLHLAAEHGRVAAVKGLVAAGATLTARDEDGRDPVTTATHAGHGAARKALRAAHGAARRRALFERIGVGAALRRLRRAFGGVGSGHRNNAAKDEA
jgi:ankyrin repeat protein